MHSKGFWVYLIVVLLILSVALTGCSGQLTTEETTPNESDNQAQIDTEQYINLSHVEPKTLDPSRATDIYASAVIQHTLEALGYIENVDGKDVIKPGAAESWDVSDDGLVWTFHIRDMQWEDGVPVKAQDFEYGIKRTLDPNTASQYAFILSPIKGADEYNAGQGTADDVGVKALDDKTLQITLEGPCPYFEQLIPFKVFTPQRQDIVEKYGEAFGSEASNYISCGPFKLESWTHNNQIVLAKNDNYWNKDNIKLSKVNYKIINDENTRYNMLLNGELDMLGVTKKEWQQRFDETGNFNVTKGYDPSANYEFFNQNDKLFSNANVRKAFSLAITREDMANVIFNGAYEAAYGWVPPSITIGDKIYRDEVEEPLRKLQEENPDPKQLLIKGLQELGMDPDPSKVTVTILQSGTDQWYRTYTEYLQQMYKNTLGVNIEAEYVEWPVFLQRVDNGEYQMAGMGWTGDYNDPHTFFDMFLSTSNMVNTGWANEEFDNAVREAGSITDNARRLELYEKAENILLYEDCVIAPTMYRTRNTYVYKYVNDLMLPVFAEVDFRYAYTSGRESIK